MSKSIKTIGDLVEIAKGKKAVELFFEPGEARCAFLQIDDVRGKSTCQYTRIDSGVYANASDIIIVWDGANSGTVGWGVNGIIGSTLARLKIKEPSTVYPPFLGRFLQSNFKLLNGSTTGSTIPHVDGAKLRSLKVSLPALSEQRRIASILDKADAIRRKRRQAIETIEDFLQSSFVNLVGEGHPDYPNWTEYTIESLAAKEKGSLRTGPFGSALRHSEFVDSGIAVLGIDNAVNNVFRWDERRFITPQKYEEMKKYTVKPNDVIITIMGTTGRSAVVPNDIPLAISTKHLATITCNRELIEPEFLSNAFHRDGAVLKQLRGANRGAIMDGLNLGIIKSTKLKVPPLAQQYKFNRVLERVRKIQISLDVSDLSIRELVGALSARSFSGARE